MHKPLLFSLLVGLTTGSALAEAPTPDAVAPVAPPAATSSEVRDPYAPSAAPPPAAPPSAPLARPPYGYRAPSPEAPPPAVSPATYALPPPILHPIQPPPRRKYGDAGAPIAVGVGGSVLWRRDHGYDVFRDGSHNGALELTASYDVWTPFPRTIVAAGLSFRLEPLVDDGPLDLRLQHRTVQAELSARYGATRWLWPHLRAAVGLVGSQLRAHDEAADIRFSDRDLDVASTFGAGFTVRTPARTFETFHGHLSSLSLGVLVEAGYTLAKASTLDAKPTESGEIARARFSVGSLARSAPYLRIMGVVRF